MNRYVDDWLAVVVSLLIALGLVMVFSASAVLVADEGGTGFSMLVRQGIAVGVGLVVCVATAATPTRLLRRYRHGIYAACVAGLLCTYVPGIGVSINGAARWIGFGSVHLQPSEFAKVGVLIALADYLARWRSRLNDWRVVARAMLVPAPAMLLVLFEPDFGTAFIIGVLVALMLVIAGIRGRYILVMGASAVVVGVPVMLLEEYRVERFKSFLDPWAVQDGAGYHVIQSWVAMHSGGLWGEGFGNSLAKLHYLPEPWTDFIGAIIAEELGLVRFLLVLVLYVLLIWRGLVIARRARDAFGTYLAATLAVMVGLEAFLHLGVVTGLVPPKGLVLPFISYGATAMMSHLWAVGILLGIAAEAEPDSAHAWKREEPPMPARMAAEP